MRSTASIQLEAVSPGLFTANSDGQGAPAALVMRAVARWYDSGTARVSVHGRHRDVGPRQSTSACRWTAPICCCLEQAAEPIFADERGSDRGRRECACRVCRSTTRVCRTGPGQRRHSERPQGSRPGGPGADRRQQAGKHRPISLPIGPLTANPANPLRGSAFVPERPSGCSGEQRAKAALQTGAPQRNRIPPGDSCAHERLDHV